VLTSETFESHENCTRHQEAEVVGRPLLSRQRSSKLSLPLKAAQPAGPTEGDARDVGLRRIHKVEVLNAQDAEGRTALMHAAQCLHAPTIRVLLDAGADRNLVDVQGRTAQMLAHGARNVGKSRAKAQSLSEFRNVSAATISNPPLIAARKEHVAISKEGMHGVGAFVLDVGTGSCKLMLWMRFSSVTLHELVEIKELDFKGMFEHGKTDPDPKADPRFNVLIEELHAAMDEAFAKQTLIQQCLITNLCVGVTAWYRQMNSELRDLGVVVLDALRDELELKARALADSTRIDAEWIEVEQTEEAMWEHKSVEYALQRAGLDPPLALLSGGQGSVQLSGLDGFTSFNLPLKQQIKDIDSDPGGRTSGLEKWRRIVRDTVGKGVLSSHLNKAAVDSQNENSEPVRLVLISGLFYVAKAAGVVRDSSDSYAFQPASVVLEEMERMLAKVDDMKMRTQDLAGAVRLSELLKTLFDEAHVQRVELLFARDWTLPPEPDPSKKFNFRTTWTAGWWLDKLSELYRTDTHMELTS